MRKCENKYRPMLHCDGKCQLMKKIEAQRKAEQQQAPELKVVAKSEVVSSRSSFLISTPNVFVAVNHEYYSINTGTPVDQPSSFFHPPDC